ncbi:uncharacterized protein YqgQ [Laceyella sediminis]|jgi:uncharacterized protein YqgQ|uniref:Uncharacterized protein YqgQ n=2 Tax=Laceyella sediminis TaxID=573074 RepID=A0ABX5ETV9_9BACL|nr:uncharacterized protein YqgQ [Laceyella sediminis]
MIELQLLYHKGGNLMRTFADVRKLLKQFGTVIYTGDHLGDCELILDELREMKSYGMIDADTYRMAVMIVKSSQQRQA